MLSMHRHYLINIASGTVHVDLTYTQIEKDNKDDYGVPKCTPFFNDIRIFCINSRIYI